MISYADDTPVTFQWNGVSIDYGPKHFELMIALYRDMLGMTVVELEAQWVALISPDDGTRINIGSLI